MKALFIVLITSLIIITSCGEEDISPPIISLIGDTTMTIAKDGQYLEPGATALDDVDGDISDQINIGGTVNTAIEDTYYINYNVTDAAGNEALEQIRKVKVLIF